MDPKEYPANWRDIADAIKAAADWTCEHCGRKCRESGETLEAFKARLLESAMNDEEGLAMHVIEHTLAEVDAHPIRFILTVHHPNHDKDNPDAVLIALCSGCHLRADAPHHAQNARETRRRKKGQIHFSISES